MTFSQERARELISMISLSEHIMNNMFAGHSLTAVMQRREFQTGGHPDFAAGA
jgi:hypothetical protein